MIFIKFFQFAKIRKYIRKTKQIAYFLNRKSIIKRKAQRINQNYIVLFPIKCVILQKNRIVYGINN